MKETKTVGELACELQKKEDEKINPIDLQRTMHQGKSSDDSFENQLRIAVERGRIAFEKDFFVVVLFKKERLLKNVIRQYFFPRESCPTPHWDQIVYHYNKLEDNLKLIWVIPDQATAHMITKLKDDLDPEQMELVKCTQDFISGKLDALCDRFQKQRLLSA